MCSLVIKIVFFFFSDFNFLTYYESAYIFNTFLYIQTSKSNEGDL